MNETKKNPQHPAAHKSLFATAEAVFGACLVAGICLELLWPFSYLGLHVSRFTLVGSGLVLMLAGVGLIWVTRRHFSKHGQPRAPGRATTQLLTTGPFAYSRNPLYLGTVLIIAGISLLADMPWILATLLPAVFVANIALIRPEERYLESQFADEWHTYAASVRRWL